MKNINKKRILIEPLLFGDYAVAIYDANNELLLDKKYFTAGYISAWDTARELKCRKEWNDCKVFVYQDDKEEEITPLSSLPVGEETEEAMTANHQEDTDMEARLDDTQIDDISSDNQ